MAHTRFARSKRLTIVAALAAAALLPAAADAEAASATYLGAADGVPVTGTRGGYEWYEGHVGTYFIRIDGMDPVRQAYSVDFERDVDEGESLPQVPSDYPHEVAYIINNAYPQPNRIGVALADSDAEAAAVQSAIWAYTDNFVATDPPHVAQRAAEIVDRARQAARQRPPAPPHSIRIDAPRGVRQVSDVHRATVTVFDGWGRPATGPSFQIEVIDGPSAGRYWSLRGPSANVSYRAPRAGIDQIEASAMYAVPSGQKFKLPGRQGIALAGDPVIGTITATSSVSWVDCGHDDHSECSHECRNPVCGDGIVQGAEQCDDGNDNDNDDCTNACKVNVCGDEIVNPWTEECDDGNALMDDGCTHDCRLPRCGDGIVQTAELCDDGNTVGGDDCPADCGRRDPEARLALTCEVTSRLTPVY